MVDYTYRGESPAKKIARLLWWEQTKYLLGGRFCLLPHLILAGPQCCDAAVLQALGVPVQHINVIDRDIDCVIQARRLFPGIRAVRADVLDWAMNQPIRFGSALLDFCSPIRATTLQSLRCFTRKSLTVGGVLGGTFMVGREKDCSEALAAYRMPGEASTHAGSIVCRVRLIDAVLRTDICLRTHGAFYYRSRTADHRGQPMLMYSGQVDRAARCIPEPTAVGLMEGEQYVPYDDSHVELLTRTLVQEGRDARGLLALTRKEFASYTKTLVAFSEGPMQKKKKHNPVNIEFGKALRERRTQCRKSKGDVAELVKVSLSCVSNWENGHCAPSLTNYKALCHAVPGLPPKPVTVKPRKEVSLVLPAPTPPDTAAICFQEFLLQFTPIVRDRDKAGELKRVLESAEDAGISLRGLVSALSEVHELPG